MKAQAPLAWLNGAILPVADAIIDPADRGFLLGDGVFETIRMQSGVAWHLQRHLARLRQGAGLLDIPLGWNDAAIAAAIAAIAPEGEAMLRLTLTRGPGPRGVLPPASVSPTLLLTAGALPALGPVAVVIATITRRNEHSPLSRIKSLNYLDSILARQEAARRGAGEAILLNSAGDVAEASAANLFCRIGGVWATPRVADGALPGIARGLMVERHGARERRVTVAELIGCEGAFLCNSLGARAVLSVEGRRLPPVSVAGLLTP